MAYGLNPHALLDFQRSYFSVEVSFFGKKVSFYFGAINIRIILRQL